MEIDDMTVFAIPMEKDKVIDEKVICEFITQGRKRSLERKNRCFHRDKGILNVNLQ